jgi:type VI protein secretion system component VasF
MQADSVAWASGLFGLVASIIVIAFMISVSGNLRAIRDEAERQTGLLERIVKGLRQREDVSPKQEAPADGGDALYEAFQPTKIPLGLIAGIGLVVVIVVIAILSRR